MTHHPFTLHCSFCGKSQVEVVRLIAGPSVFICDECVLQCIDIIVAAGVEVHPDIIRAVEEAVYGRRLVRG